MIEILIVVYIYVLIVYVLRTLLLSNYCIIILLNYVIRCTT